MSRVLSVQKCVFRFKIHPLRLRSAITKTLPYIKIGYNGMPAPNRLPFSSLNLMY